MYRLTVSGSAEDVEVLLCIRARLGTCQLHQGRGARRFMHHRSLLPGSTPCN